MGEAIKGVEMFHKTYFCPFCFLIFGDTHHECVVFLCLLTIIGDFYMCHFVFLDTLGDTRIDIYWCHFGWRKTISRVEKAIKVVEMFHKIYFSPLCFLIIGDTRLYSYRCHFGWRNTICRVAKAIKGGFDARERVLAGGGLDAITIPPMQWYNGS